MRSDYFQYEYESIIVNKNSIRLGRGVKNHSDYNYVQQVVKRIIEARHQSLDYVEFATDVISFYALEPYRGELEFHQIVEFKNILIYDKAVNIESGIRPYSENEFIVVNSNPLGTIRINIQDIKYKIEIEKDAMSYIKDHTKYRNNMFFLPDFVFEVKKEKERRILSKTIKAIQGIFSRFFSTLITVFILIWLTVQLVNR